jgi:antirestriction protein
MISLYANPYDFSVSGFYFSTLDEYEKQAKASGAEEFEIDFIDGTATEQMLFNAMRVDLGGDILEAYFNVVNEFDEDDAMVIAILTDDMGYTLEQAMDMKDDLAVYGKFDSDEQFAQEYVDSIGSLEDALGDKIQNYFDYASFGRDVQIDFDEEESEIYEGMSDQEIGEQLADDFGWEGIGKSNLENYFDWERFARDLMFDMSKYEGTYYDPQSV